MCIIWAVMHEPQTCEGHVLETCSHADAAGITTAQRGLKQHIS